MQDLHGRLKIFLSLFLMVTLIGTIGFMVLEKLTFTDAFYYNIVTMSTVGYGDIHPTNPASRLFAVFLIVMGGATFIGVIATASELLIARRESQNRARKVNMVLGVFFIEVGRKLLDIFSDHDHSLDKVRKHLLVNYIWSESNFANSLKVINGYKTVIDASKLDLEGLKYFLNGKRDLLLNLLENPVIIEHEGFSDTLLSVFHLLDELSNRNELDSLPNTDIKHLTGDINRAYKKLMTEWIV